MFAKRFFLTVLFVVSLLSFLNSQEKSEKVKIKRKLVTFVYNNPSAKRVQVVGDFNNWNEYAHPMEKNAEGIWQKEILIREGRSYEYAFMVDGEIIADPVAISLSDNGLSILDLDGSKETSKNTEPGRTIEKSDSTENKLSETDENLTKQLEFLTKAMVKQNELLNRYFDDAIKKDATIDLLRKEVSELKSTNSSLTKESTELKAKMETFNSDFEKLATELASTKKLYDETAEELKTLKKNYSEVQVKYNTMLQESGDYKSVLQDLQMQLQQKEKENEDLSSKLKEVMQRLFDSESMLKSLTKNGKSTKESELSEKTESKENVDKDKTEIPKTSKKGTVLVTSDKINVMIIDIGKKSNVNVGDVFIVMRQDKLIGKVRVFQVDEKTSNCRIIEKNEPVREGDEIFSEK